ncbi:unnamed protein product, partial [Cyprideis torosa]
SKERLASAEWHGQRVAYTRGKALSQRAVPFPRVVPPFSSSIRCTYRLSLRNMSLALCLFLCLLSWTGANGSCPGDYQSVSYTLRSKVVEACFFVSTDYVRWADGADFCGRRSNGSLAEFVSAKKLQAFREFLSTMSNATKEELWDAEHAWIGGAVLNGSVWRWNSSKKELSPFISEELPINDFYGLTINVHSKAHDLVAPDYHISHLLFRFPFRGTGAVQTSVSVP